MQSAHAYRRIDALAKRTGSIPLTLPNSSTRRLMAMQLAPYREHGEPMLRLDYLTKRLQFEFDADFNWLVHLTTRIASTDESKFLRSFDKVILGRLRRGLQESYRCARERWRTD